MRYQRIEMLHGEAGFSLVRFVLGHFGRTPREPAYTHGLMRVIWKFGHRFPGVPPLDPRVQKEVERLAADLFAREWRGTTPPPLWPSDEAQTQDLFSGLRSHDLAFRNPDDFEVALETLRGAGEIHPRSMGQALEVICIWAVLVTPDLRDNCPWGAIAACLEELWPVLMAEETAESGE